MPRPGPWEDPVFPPHLACAQEPKKGLWVDRQPQAWKCWWWWWYFRRLPTVEPLAVAEA